MEEKFFLFFWKRKKEVYETIETISVQFFRYRSCDKPRKLWLNYGGWKSLLTFDPIFFPILVFAVHLVCTRMWRKNFITQVFSPNVHDNPSVNLQRAANIFLYMRQISRNQCRTLFFSHNAFIYYAEIYAGNKILQPTWFWIYVCTK